MAISGVKFYGKTFKGSRYIIRKNKKITRGPKNKKFTRGRKLTKIIKITKKDSTNDVYPNNKLYEQCPKSKDCTNNVYPKNKLYEQCSKSKELTNDVYPKNKLYEYCPKSMGISGNDFYGRSFKRSRYIIQPMTGRKLPKLIKISKKDHTNDVYKTNKIIEYCPLCLIKLTPIQFTIHLKTLIMKTICVCGVTIEIKPYNRPC